MKRIIAIFTFLFIAGYNLNAQAKMEFEQETIDYGEVAYKSDGVRVFKFTNTGDEPLIIKEVKSTCGCTVPKKPKDAIAPGDTGEIEVKYDTSRQGPIRKTVTVYSNAEKSPYPLKIKGYVQKKDTKSILEK